MILTHERLDLQINQIYCNFIRNSTPFYEDWAWDGEVLTVFTETDNETYSYNDLKQIIPNFDIYE